MSDFWWQVQQQEEEEWQELLKRDPGYAQWLDIIQDKTGCENTKQPMTNFTNPQEKAA